MPSVKLSAWLLFVLIFALTTGQITHASGFCGSNRSQSALSGLSTGQRVDRFIDTIRNPESSPLLKVAFPESYIDGFELPHLKDALVSNIKNNSNRSIESSLSELTKAFDRSLRTSTETFDQLKNSKHFNNFVKQNYGTEGLKTISSIDTLVSLKELQARNSKKPKNSNHHSEQEIIMIDKQLSLSQKEIYNADKAIDYLGMVEAYKQEILMESKWDPALNLYPSNIIPHLESKKFQEYEVHHFLNKTLLINGKEFKVVKKLGSGAESYVYEVKNSKSGNSKVIKITRQKATTNNLYQSYIKIRDAGYPVVEINPISKNFNDVERISTFGNDSLSKSIATGDLSHFKESIDFFKQVESNKTLDLSDIKLRNIGKNKKGQWVITDWIINPKNSEAAHRSNLKNEFISDSFLEILDAAETQIKISPRKKQTILANAKASASLLLKNFSSSEQTKTNYRVFNEELQELSK